MSNHHTIKEEDGICIQEMNGFWSKMCKSNPEPKAKDGIIIKSEACPVLIWAERHSVRKKPMPKKKHNKARMQFANADRDEYLHVL